MTATAHCSSASSETPGCCERCAVKLSRLCCDSCEVLLQSFVREPHRKPTQRAKHKVKVPDYSMTEPECTLHRKLEEWRELQMIEEDLDGDAFFGPQIVMSNGVLNHIIDLAHAHKIPDVTSLFAQTNWVYSDSYGQKIVDIIQVTIPTLLKPSQSLSSQVARTASIPQHGS